MTVWNFLQSLSDERFADYMITVVTGVISKLWFIEIPENVKEEQKKVFLEYLRKDINDR